MPDQINYLIGNGERLTRSVERFQGGSPKKPAYDFGTAIERIGGDLVQTTSLFQQLPREACPDDEAVAAVTMHPRFLSKSDYPLNALGQAGLRTLGSKSTVISPNEWGISKHPEKATTTVLFVAGKRQSFDRWSRSFQESGGSHVSTEITKFESVAPVTASDRIRSVPDEDEVKLELVLHTDSRGRITEAFEAYAHQTSSVLLDLKRVRTVGNLCFMPATAARDSVEELAKFTFLRVVRGMPTLRPLITPGIRVADVSQQISIHSEPALDESCKIAIFDGGLPDHVSLPWVTEYATTGVGPKHSGCTEHGLAVTSAALFGHVNPDRLLPTPFSRVDHYRVLGQDPGSYDEDMYDVLDRIVEVLKNEANEYEFVNLSLGPRMAITDDDVTLWTAELDQLLGGRDILTTVAVGNDGKLDEQAGLNRIQPPSDGVNVLSVGSTASKGMDWTVADYSCIGPGRSPGLVKPDLVSFGGSLSEPFLALRDQSSIFGKAGTSFAAPSVLRLGAAVKAAFGSSLSPLAIRALLIHHATPLEHEQRKVGWGRVPEDVTNLISSAGDTVHVVYEGTVPFGVQIRADIPQPHGGFDGMVNIAATFCITSAVDPHHSNTYTRSGLEVVFRPNKDVYTQYSDGSQSRYAKPASFFSQRHMYSQDDLLRNDTHKWEPVLSSSVRKRATTLNEPCFDIYRSEREEGAAPSDTDLLRYALIVTVRAKKMSDLYDQIVRTYNQILVPLRPRVDVRIRT